MMKSKLKSGSSQANQPTPANNERAPRTAEQFWIVLIDRKPLTRHCLELWLQGLWRESRISSVSSPEEFVNDSQSFADADMIIYNTGSTWVADLASDIDRFLGSLDNVPLVFLSDSEEIDDILEAIEYGARGYIATTLTEADAAEAMRFIRSGGTFVPANCLVRSIRHRSSAEERERPGAGAFQVERLTRRETEVLALLRQGKPDKVIAHELNISPSTVKVFVRQILLKLHARNRTEVAYLTCQDQNGAKSHEGV